jgi:hypothetical protein
MSKRNVVMGLACSRKHINLKVSPTLKYSIHHVYLLQAAKASRLVGKGHVASNGSKVVQEVQAAAEQGPRVSYQTLT